METIFWANLIFPFFVSVITFYVFGKSSELKMRQNKSKLGSMIIEALIGDVRNGIDIMNSLVELVENPPTAEDRILIHGMPTSSWSGKDTISDDVLLRIISCSKEKEYVCFHPTGIFIHSKNYFEHMCSNVNRYLIEEGTIEEKVKGAYNYIKSTDYINTANDVLKMLYESKKLLDENSKRKWPK